MERLIKFEICGQEYSLNTDASEDDIHEILELVKSQIGLHSKSTTVLPLKLAVLVSLNMAGKYVRLKREFEEYRANEKNKIATLVDNVERYL